MWTVLASGSFDLVHYGHVRFLEEAKKAGGKDARLVVIVARDITVERLKGIKPVIPEDQRRAVVEALKPVDEALLGFENMSIMDVILKLKPDIIAVGYDQNYVEEEVKRIATMKDLDFKIIRIGRFGPLILNSSSKIRRKIVELEEQT
jgi:FAD synthetase